MCFQVDPSLELHSRRELVTKWIPLLFVISFCLKLIVGFMKIQNMVFELVRVTKILIIKMFGFVIYKIKETKCPIKGNKLKETSKIPRVLTQHIHVNDTDISFSK